MVFPPHTFFFLFPLPSRHFNFIKSFLLIMILITCLKSKCTLTEKRSYVGSGGLSAEELS